MPGLGVLVAIAADAALLGRPRAFARISGDLEVATGSRRRLAACASADDVQATHAAA